MESIGSDELRTSSDDAVVTESAAAASIVTTKPLPALQVSAASGRDVETQKCCNVSLWKLHSTSTNCPQDGGSGEMVDITVDIIIPVHNSSSTIRETIASAMHQIWFIDQSSSSSNPPNIAVHVCCYNDASTDDSWRVLKELYDSYSTAPSSESNNLTDGAICDTITSYRIPTQLWISSSPPDSTARGPGYARNRAVEMRDTIIATHSTVSTAAPTAQHFICWLDSDDIMHPTRVYYQVHHLMQLPPESRLKTLLGTNFDRFITTGESNDTNGNLTPGDNHTTGITPHYTSWANELSPERLYLERFRELTIIQPTWMMCRYRYTHILRGYLEPPSTTSHGPSDQNEHFEDDNKVTTSSSTTSSNVPDNEPSFSEWIRNVSSTHEPNDQESGLPPWRLVHTEIETSTTIRVAEDLRFFHEHFYYGGLVQRTIATSAPLVSYRHRPGISQSALTSRKLLLALRVAAFEQMVLNSDETNVWNDKFIIWGAGRDGKDFVKALSPPARQRVYCLLDVDDAKIARGFYQYFSPASANGTKKRRKVLNIPIIHFSTVIKDPTKRSLLYDSWKSNKVSEDDGALPFFGRVVKNQESKTGNDVSSATIQSPQSKRIKVTPGNIEKNDPGMTSIDPSLLPNLPVVVCVTMYRTNGALEGNVNLIDRIEGKDLWHFS